MRIDIYYSSVPSTLQVRKDTTRMQDILAANKIEYQMVDVAAGQVEKDYMHQRSGKRVLPQLFVDGEYRGCTEDLELANECGTTLEFINKPRLQYFVDIISQQQHYKKYIKIHKTYKHHDFQVNSTYHPTFLVHS
jgi:glutaredoxin